MTIDVQTIDVQSGDIIYNPNSDKPIYWLVVQGGSDVRIFDELPPNNYVYYKLNHHDDILSQATYGPDRAFVII